GTATGATAGTCSTAGANAATGTRSTAATFAHALCGRQADAREQHGRGQQEPTLSNAVHMNLLRYFAIVLDAVLSNRSVPFNGDARRECSSEFSDLRENGAPTLFVPFMKGVARFRCDRSSDQGSFIGAN